MGIIPGLMALACFVLGVDALFLAWSRRKEYTARDWLVAFFVCFGFFGVAALFGVFIWYSSK